MNSVNVKITVEEWIKMVAAGANVPITTKLQGYSMQPLIRFDRDVVTIVPAKEELVPGMIVMFHRSDGAFVAHRVYRIGGDKRDIFAEGKVVIPEGWVQTWGDNCLGPDAPVKREEVLGQLVSMNKDGRTVRLDTAKQYAYGIRWFRWYIKPWIFYKRLRSLAGRAARKLHLR